MSHQTSLEMKKGLPAKEVDRRLVAGARAHRRIESVLSFYLQEVEERRLYLKYGFASTIDYARERAGFRRPQDAVVGADSGAARGTASTEESIPDRRPSLDQGAGGGQGGNAGDGKHVAGQM